MCDRHYAVCRVECLHSRSCVLKVQHFEQNVSIRALWGEIIISFIMYIQEMYSGIVTMEKKNTHQ